MPAGAQAGDPRRVITGVTNRPVPGHTSACVVWIGMAPEDSFRGLSTCREGLFRAPDAPVRREKSRMHGIGQTRLAPCVARVCPGCGCKNSVQYMGQVRIGVRAGAEACYDSRLASQTRRGIGP